MTMPVGLSLEEGRQWRRDKTVRERVQREATPEGHALWKNNQKAKNRRESELYPDRVRERRRRHNQSSAGKASTAAWKDSNLERTILARAKHGAKRRGFEFNLDISDIVVPDLCPVLGIPLVKGVRRDRKRTHGTPSIDRIDNSRGYVKGNIVIVSWRANILKRDATPAELAMLAAFYCK